jgi:hypothetical protein
VPGRLAIDYGYSMVLEMFEIFVNGPLFLFSLEMVGTWYILF